MLGRSSTALSAPCRTDGSSFNGIATPPNEPLFLPTDVKRALSGTFLFPSLNPYPFSNMALFTNFKPTSSNKGNTYGSDDGIT